MKDLPITSSEAARTLGVTTMTVTRWAKSGRLTPIRKLRGQKGAYLFDPAEVERIAATRKETTTA